MKIVSCEISQKEKSLNLKLTIFIIVAILTQCKSKSTQIIKEKEIIKTSDSSYIFIAPFTVVAFKNHQFKKLKCGLYIDETGEISFKTIDNSDSIPSNRYIDIIYGADENDSLYGGIMKMAKVVDTATFQNIGGCYYKDKNHIYIFHQMMDGGTIAVNPDADIKTFISLNNGWYGKDKKHCFYHGRLIEQADAKSFKMINDSFHFNAMDKNNFYDGDNIMTKQEIKELGLDNIKLK